LTYILTVTNNGPSLARNVVINDTYPDGFTFVSSTPIPDTGHNNRWTFPSLAVSANQTVTITGTAPATGGSISNLAGVTSTTPDPIEGNNIATERTEVTPSADLSIAKSVNADPIVTGHLLTYTLTVTNLGPSVATNVVVTETYPAGFFFGSSNPTPSSGNDTWSLGSIAASNTRTITITGNVTATGGIDDNFLVNLATVTSTNDPNLDNNTSGHDVKVTASIPYIVSTKTVALAIDANHDFMPSAGDTLLYFIEMSNIGYATATGVIFTDSPDPNTTLLAGSVTTTQGSVSIGNSISDRTVEVIIGNIPVHGIVTVTFRVTINQPLKADHISNQGLTTGVNFSDAYSDDPRTGEPNDPTVIEARPSPKILVPGLSYGGIMVLVVLTGGVMLWVMRRRKQIRLRP